MTETEHTPAPWPVEYDNSDNLSGGQWYDVGPAKIKFPYNASEDDAARARADADLVSAAPEMLTACREALSILEATSMADDPDGSPSDDQSPITDAVALVRAAIAKATGAA